LTKQGQPLAYKGLTNPRGTIIFSDVRSQALSVSASFASGRDQYQYDEPSFEIDKFPYTLEIPRKGSWRIDKILWGCAFVSWVFREAGFPSLKSALCADWRSFGIQQV
jgi:hypothetical protein